MITEMVTGMVVRDIAIEEELSLELQVVADHDGGGVEVVLWKDKLKEVVLEKEVVKVVCMVDLWDSW